MRNTPKRVLTALSLTLLSSQPSIGIGADLLLSGQIYTANDDAPMVEAVVITEGRFSYVGSLDGALEAVTDDHQRVALGSKTAYPGFIESHGHLSSLGLSLIHI